jgi:hypothetical protein
MPFYDRMMLSKRYIIETINDMLKNLEAKRKANDKLKE